MYTYVPIDYLQIYHCLPVNLIFKMWSVRFLQESCIVFPPNPWPSQWMLVRLRLFRHDLLILAESSVTLSTSFVFVNCASISAIFQIQYLMFFFTYQRATPLSAAVSLAAATFSLYLAFIEISCV